jgi:hypothetical protein
LNICHLSQYPSTIRPTKACLNFQHSISTKVMLDQYWIISSGEKVILGEQRSSKEVETSLWDNCWQHWRAPKAYFWSSGWNFSSQPWWSYVPRALPWE